MPNLPTIRDAVREDAATIAEIAAEWPLADPSYWKDAAAVREQIAGFGPREAYLLIESRDQVLGWGLIQLYSDRLGYRFCSELSLCLRKSSVGQGLGAGLEEAMAERCRRWGYHHLLLRTYADNQACLEFHKNRGYRVVGVQHQVCRQDGWRDVVILERILETASDEGRGGDRY